LFVVVGLGNPRRRYRKNRHNVGFMVADTLASRRNVKFKRWRNLAKLCEFDMEGISVMLARPLTFMNRSGSAVSAIVGHYQVPTDNVIVIHDDLDLPTGRLRLKRGGSSGGHKGVQSVIDEIGPDFLRVRIGIGKPETTDETIDYVLSDFSKDQAKEIERAIERAADATEMLIASNFERAAEIYNRGETKLEGDEP